MEKVKLDCPIKGLIYEKNVGERGEYYSLEPAPGFKMRSYAGDVTEEDGTVTPRYLVRICMPRPYDFDTNPKGIATERVEGGEQCDEN